jgi:hypothetical protein
MLLTACAKKDASYENSGTSSLTEDYAATENSADDGEMDANTSVSGSEEDKSASSDTSTKIPENPNQKLIKTFLMDMETEEYDKLISAIQKSIMELGGYIESSEMEGNGLYDSGHRYAQIIARIPKEKVDGFVNNISKLGNVVNSSNNAKDVTLEYTDAESHQKALKIEQERLLSLLEKAVKLEDIITLEDRLSDVRYEIESYESQIRMYDNLVSYSTVTLNISEVKRITPVDNETAFDKMKIGLSNSLYNIKTGIVNLAIWFVVNLPYLIIWGVILFIGFLLWRRWYRNYKKKYQLPAEKDRKQEIQNSNSSMEESGQKERDK